MKKKSAVKKAAQRRATEEGDAVQREFTVRDLNRQPQAVLNAARAAGGVHVRSRTGERFLLKPVPAHSQKSESAVQEHLRRLEALHERMKTTDEGFTADGWETFSKVLAGE